MFSDIMGRLNQHSIYNGGVEVHSSEFPVELKSESISDPDATPNKPIDDNEMDHILEIIHSEHDEDIMCIDIHMLQA